MKPKLLLIGLSAALVSLLGAEIMINTPTASATPPGETACGVQTPPEKLLPANDEDRILRLKGQPWTGTDPHKDNYNREYVYQVFSGLMALKPDLSIIPDLARSYTLSEDGRAYTFHLRPNATFHDGHAVTAEDVKYSLQRAMNPDSYQPDLFLADIHGARELLSGETDALSGITLIDSSTVRITLYQPSADFLHRLTYRAAFIVDRENVESSEDWSQTPNGTGPFRFTHHQKDEILWLSRFDGYHREPANVAALHYNLRGCDGYLLYWNGVIDLFKTPWWIADDIPPSHPLASQLHRAPTNLSLHFMALNTNQPPFDDRKVRMALNHAVDRSQLQAVTKPLIGYVPAYGILPPSIPGYNPHGFKYEYDMEKAQELIAESKYAGDLPPVVFNHYHPPNPHHYAVLNALRELGFPVQARDLPGGWTEYAEAREEGNWQLAAGVWRADFPDPSTFLLDLLHTNSSINREAYLGYSSPTLDWIMDTTRAQQDPLMRRQFWHFAEQLALTDAPWVPLYHDYNIWWLVKPNVRGIPLSAMNVWPYRSLEIID